MLSSSQAHIELVGHWPYLVVSVSGPWDVGLARCHLAALVPTVASYDFRGSWATIVLVSGAPVMTPNALRFLRRFVMAEAQRNTKRAATALVCDPESEIRAIAEADLLTLYDGICPVGVFDDLTTAKKWITPLIKARRCSAA